MFERASGWPSIGIHYARGLRVKVELGGVSIPTIDIEQFYLIACFQQSSMLNPQGTV
jgi:hypothetical protein